jgi:hypothetical protein
MRSTTVVPAAALEVEWVKPGQLVNAPALDTGEEGPFMALAPCGDLFHLYFCETCGRELANAAQIEIHVEKGGLHRIARWCQKRNVFEAAPKVELRIEAGA